MYKKIRQQAILDIVAEKKIPSQLMLIKELEKRSFKITQATISRDVSELNLLKSADGYTCPRDENGPVTTLNLNPARSLRLMVTKIDVAQNIAVVRTIPGSAQHVGIVFDHFVFPEVVGNVADGDTVLIITKSDDDAREFRRKVLNLID